MFPNQQAASAYPGLFPQQEAIGYGFEGFRSSHGVLVPTSEALPGVELQLNGGDPNGGGLGKQSLPPSRLSLGNGIEDPITGHRTGVDGDRARTADRERSVAGFRSAASQQSILEQSNQAGNSSSLSTRKRSDDLRPDDTKPPRVVGAISNSPSTVLVRFSEAMDKSILKPSFFAISLSKANANTSSLPIREVSFDNKARTAVELTTGLQSELQYKVRVVGGTDRAGNAFAAPKRPGLDSAMAMFIGTPPKVDPRPDDTKPPRVVGAISNSPSTVLVRFSEAMDKSILKPSFFAISLSQANANVSSLPISKVSFDSKARTAVELTTGLQSELQYKVRVVGGTDRAGNAFAAPKRPGLDPAAAMFVGTPPTVDDLQLDTDRDGLTDNVELLGWQVSITDSLGNESEYRVSSDPKVADSDGDGLDDSVEQTLATDPRKADTDGDRLSDYVEFNEIFSSPNKADDDGDGLDDFLEFDGYGSSPTDSDTDGDQIPDNEEAVLASRNLRIADIPLPKFEVGNVDLFLDVRHTFENRKGETRTEDQSIQSTLTQTESTSSSTTDADSNAITAEAGFEVGWSTKLGEKGVGVEKKVSAKGGTTNSWSSSFTEESAEETQEAVAETFSRSEEATQEETVVREITGAAMKVDLTLKNLSNVAFTIKNLQITAFSHDRSQFGKLIPVATLRPDAEPEEGFTLGPAFPEREGLIFSSTDIFPSVVEKLMINPRGIVFKISNYDIIDEEERNYAFSSQDINDRTSPLVIDFGYSGDSSAGSRVIGATERYRIATSAGRKVVDTNLDGVVDEKDRTVRFDSDSRAVGITISEAMETVLGLTKYDETETPSSSLTRQELQSSYSTKVLELDTDNNPETPPLKVEALWRVREVSRELTSALKNWVIFTSDGIDTSTDFSDLVLKPESGVTLKFLQDRDDDGIDAAQEFILGSSDTQTDTDGDELEDGFEYYGGPTPADINTGWLVEVVGKTGYRAFSSPARKDSDRDGVSDYDEFNRYIEFNGVKQRRSTDPQNPDTDGDGISDGDEINGYDINNLRFSAGETQSIKRYSDPLNPDTDGDTLFDGAELTLGTDPTVDDQDKVLDDDKDGLVNFLEGDIADAGSGWTVVSVTTPGIRRDYKVVTDPSQPDTDSDGLSDKEEFDLKTDPTLEDTDGDGLTDLQEVEVTDNGADQARTINLKYNPLNYDSDFDGLSDRDEVTGWQVAISGQAPLVVNSNVMKADSDDDGLTDFEEKRRKTDPRKFDSDGDNESIGDGREVVLGTNPAKPDQLIKIEIISIGLSGVLEDDEPGQNDDFELIGTIQIGRDGESPTNIKTYSKKDVVSNWLENINASMSYVMDSELRPVTLQATGFADYDVTGSNDLFDEGSKQFKYPVKPEINEITINGDSDTGVGVKLTIKYKSSVVI